MLLLLIALVLPLEQILGILPALLLLLLLLI
jgi:hypothetical protein